MTKVISTRVLTKECIVHLASLSGQSPSLLMVNVLIVVEKFMKLVNMLID